MKEDTCCVQIGLVAEVVPHDFLGTQEVQVVGCHVVDEPGTLGVDHAHSSQKQLFSIKMQIRQVDVVVANPHCLEILVSITFSRVTNFTKIETAVSMVNFFLKRLK
jgi:hypothetical protein